MRELVLYAVAGIAWLVVLGYSVHIFIGGLVSPGVEAWAIAGVVAIGAGVLAFLARQVIASRRR